MLSFKGGIGFLLKLSVLAVILSESFIHAEPVTFTNAASELQPQHVEPPSSYWIGSHTLNFTPNPFLKGRESRQNPLGSSVINNILPSPSSSTTEIPRQRGRKVKRRRKLRNQNNSKPRNPTRREHKSQYVGKSTPETKVKGKVGNLRPRRLGRRLNSLNQSEGQLTSRPDGPQFLTITTPEPIVAELTPESSQISMEFARTHPENLNPTYFRNIIVKEMIKRIGASITQFVPAKPIKL